MRTIAAPGPLPRATSAIHKSEPKRFNEARDVADRFKEGTAVIMNLQSTEDSIARRLVDFASGLVYGLDGKIELIANRVYLLEPRRRRGLGRGAREARRRRLLQPVLTGPATGRGRDPLLAFPPDGRCRQPGRGHRSASRSPWPVAAAARAA